MKAILVIDEMPKKCSECTFGHFIDVEDYADERMYCEVLDAEAPKWGDDKPNWCPLKPLPQTKNDRYGLDKYAMGWNACLEEIEDD